MVRATARSISNRRRTSTRPRRSRSRRPPPAPTTTTTIPAPNEIAIVLDEAGLHTAPATFAAGAYPMSFTVDPSVTGRSPFVRVYDPDGRQILRLSNNHATRRDETLCAGTYRIKLNMDGHLSTLEATFAVVGDCND